MLQLFNHVESVICSPKFFNRYLHSFGVANERDEAEGWKIRQYCLFGGKVYQGLFYCQTMHYFKDSDDPLRYNLLRLEINWYFDCFDFDVLLFFCTQFLLVQKTSFPVLSYLHAKMWLSLSSFFFFFGRYERSCRVFERCGIRFDDQLWQLHLVCNSIHYLRKWRKQWFIIEIVSEIFSKYLQLVITFISLTSWRALIYSIH